VNPFRFIGAAGYFHSPDIYYIRERDYNPKTGRFLSVDPLLYYTWKSAIYAYAYNNPISYIDPSGLLCAESQIGDCSQPLPTDGKKCKEHTEWYCDQLQKRKYPGGIGGFTICCDGLMYPCVFDDSQVLPAFCDDFKSVRLKCALLHEYVHIFQPLNRELCPKAGACIPGVPIWNKTYPNPHPRECPANIADLMCLISYYEFSCQSNKSKKACNLCMEYYICDKINLLNSNYKCLKAADYERMKIRFKCGTPAPPKR
jgi:RHS repeat-associated protein